MQKRKYELAMMIFYAAQRSKHIHGGCKCIRTLSQGLLIRLWSSKANGIEEFNNKYKGNYKN